MIHPPMVNLLHQVLCFVLAAAPPATGPAADTAILRDLRKGHPRLMVLDADIARLRDLVAHDAGAAALRDGLRAYAERLLGEPPVIHELIGPRLLNQSRKCLERVAALATIYRLEGDARFLARAEKEMLAAAAFPDWNPSHFLDTAEMTNALGIGYDWLYNALTPQSRAFIRKAIVAKGLESGLAIYRKKSWWTKSEYNWNQVCNAGLTVGALAIADEEPALAAEIIENARRSLPVAMATLAPDGGWPEGASYWNYAMHYATFYWAAMTTALGAGDDWKSLPGLADAGMFRIHCLGPTDLAFNYADAGTGAGSAAQMMYLARRFDRPVYAAHERRFSSGNDAFALLWYDPRGSSDDIAQLPTAAVFKRCAVVLMRSRWNDPNATFVGFRIGDNAVNHGHLDMGTFVLDALGHRWAMDLGSDDYNLPGYFGKQRWTYYRLRTEGHNTLVLDGRNQDEKARGTLTSFETTPQKSVAVADLSAGYAAQSAHVRRTISLDQNDVVTVRDEIEPGRAADIAWSMHTGAKLQTDGGLATLTIRDKKLYARVLEPASIAWEASDVQTRPPQRPLTNVHKLMLHVKPTTEPLRIVVQFSADKARLSKQ